MRRLAPFLIAAGIALVVGGALLLSRGPTTSGDLNAVEDALRPAPSPAAPPAATPSVDEPGSNPTDITTESSPPEPATVPQPVGLRIDSLEIDAPVAPYGVDASGQMDVPDNVTEVAWSGPGVFFDLDKLDEGDRITVLYEDGTEAGFRVVARGVYEKDQLPLDVVFSREGPSVLTLITCGGDFNRSISRYDSNVVVYAVPVGDGKPTSGSSL